MGQSYSSHCSPETPRARGLTKQSKKLSLAPSEVIMKKFLFRSLLIVAVLVVASLPALADTIRLKDGSVVRGQIVEFKNEQFTIEVGSGARGRKSRITVYMEDVDSIEFDSVSTTRSTGPNDSTVNTQPTYQPPANTQPTNN